MNKAILVDHKELELENKLISFIGHEIHFINGCSISLKDDDGVFWGCTPYGQDWCCNSKDGWVASIINWVNFWSEPRDESGSLLKK